MEGSFEPSPGIRLRYKIAGTGEHTMIVANTGLLPDLEPLVRRGRRLVELHSRGRGGSTRPAEDELGLRHEASDIVALADHLGLGTFALLGWSYAGFVAALAAVEHPARVSRLVLMCAMPPYHDPAWPAPAPPPELAAAADCRDFLRVHRRWRMANPDAAQPSRADPCRWENERPERLGATMRAVLGSLPGVELRSRLPAITAPALVVHGDADIIPLDGAQAYVEGIPHAALLRLPDVGHYPHLERPDLFFPAVDAFLDGR